MNVKTLSRVALYIQILGSNIIITVPQENEKSLKELTQKKRILRKIQKKSKLSKSSKKRKNTIFGSFGVILKKKKKISKNLLKSCLFFGLFFFSFFLAFLTKSNVKCSNFFFLTIFFIEIFDKIILMC